MSPVSRGRKPKKARKGKKPRAHVTSSGWAKAAKREFGGLSLSVPRSPLEESFGSLDRRPRWWAPSFERLIAASGGLLVAQGPRALEQATAELIGAELYRAVHDEKTGLRFDAWAMELISRAIERMVDAAGRGDNTWRGPWWLLQGLAAIGSYGLGAFAWEQASEAAGELPRDIRAAEPAWLKLLPDIKATGHVLAMRDAYGTRFGVIADFSYPGGADPSAYLLDFDASGFTVLAGAGVFDDVAPMADPFAKWYSERHGHEPGRDAVEALAEEWLEGMLPGTEHSVSPHRTEFFRELISDWRDDPVTDAALALLPEWVRWNGEQSGVPAPLIERAVSAASAGPDQP